MRSLLSFLCSGVILGSLVSVGRAAEVTSAAGDADRGKTLFQQNCALCHAAVGLGPNLVGVIGRKSASTANFGYTKAMTEANLTWDHATLDRFLANPMTMVPGTTMVAPIPVDADRRDLIAYLAVMTSPPAPVAPATAGQGSAASSGPDVNDWRHAAPGLKYAVAVTALPAPYSTPSTRNNSVVVDRPANATPSVPEGFTVRLFAQGLSGPRLMHVAPNGDIFIAETRSNRIRVLRAADGGETVSANELFADGLDRPFGMAFYPAGNDPQWVYIANNNSVVRFPYRNGDMKARAAAQVVVPKLSETTGGHSTRDVAFSKDGRRLFITVGSQSNFAEGLPVKSREEIVAWEKEHGLGATWDFEFHRANILVTDPEGKQPLKIFATGIRNPVGLAVNSITGELWTSTNERDGLGDNLVPDYVTSVKEGHFYGWPWYYLGNNEEPRHAGVRPDLAGKATVPDVPVQAHSAALGIAFYTATAGAAAFPVEYRGELFVALHGSWNRAIRTGYKVVRARMKDGKATGQYEDFLTGFVADDKNVWGRPVGVAVARDGALLVSEDGNGTVWRVTPKATR